MQIEKIGIHVRPSMPSSHPSRARSRQELDDLEERISEHENRLLQMNNSHETMQRRYLELTELKHVLRETSDFFQEVIDPALKLNRDKIKNSHYSDPITYSTVTDPTRPYYSTLGCFSPRGHPQLV